MDPIPQVPHVAGPPPRQFEFNEEQNRVIDDLAAAMRWATLPLYLLAAIGVPAAGLEIALAVTQKEPYHWWLTAVAVIQAVVLFTLARWLSKAANAFDRVAHTTQWDITHLMNGLRQLDKFFGILRVVAQLLVLSAVVAMVLLLIAILGRPQVAA